jgi:hypothetical protein
MQLIHADTQQRFDVFPLMLTASLEQARVAHECLKTAQLVNHRMPW